MDRALDPRSKLMIVLCISSLGLLFRDLAILLTVLLASLIISWLTRSNLFMLIRRLKGILYIFGFMIILQSLFAKGGEPMLILLGRVILTSTGLELGLGYLMRVLIILISGSIVATCKQRDLIQGLIQMKIPYELAFMTSLGIRFLPTLIEEFKDTSTAIALRGIDINGLPIKQRIEIISYIITPVFVGALYRARNLALSIDCRGFRAYDTRTSILNLKLKAIDFIVMGSALVGTALLIYIGLMR